MLPSIKRVPRQDDFLPELGGFTAVNKNIIATVEIQKWVWPTEPDPILFHGWGKGSRTPIHGVRV